MLGLLEDSALRVGDASNAGESETLEVGTVGGELGASDGIRTLVVEAEGGTSNSLGGSVGLLSEGDDGSLLGSTADLNANSVGVSEARELVASHVDHIVGLSSESNSDVGAVSAGEAVVLAGNLPDKIGGSQRQSSAIVRDLSSHYVYFIAISIPIIPHLIRDDHI